MKKQIADAAWSIFVLASVTFVFSFVFAFLNSVIEIFILNE
ncbi:MAG: hypothetical protein Q8R17_02890 [bacterium]|nr:hypothetical protein [bacterium]